MLKTDATAPHSIDARLDLLDEEPDRFSDEIAALTKVRAAWNDADPEASRAEAIRVIDEIVANYADVLDAPRSPYGPVLLEIDRSPSGPGGQPRQPLGELAEALRFELEHLTVGRHAPEIAGSDVHGDALKLSDQRGKVVVLMFSFKGCGPCEGMYPDNRQLIEEYAERPFAFLGVMSDPTIDTVKASIEDGTITWRVWWDGVDDSISRRWNVQGWPKIYVLDHNGIIRYRELRGDVLNLAVAKLVVEAERER